VQIRQRSVEGRGGVLSRPAGQCVRAFRVTVQDDSVLSAAFDYVEHDLLLQWLQYSFGPSGVVLDSIHSFLTKPTQQRSTVDEVEVNYRRSEHCCSASHKGLCLGRYCIFCTLRNSNKWLHSMICIYISSWWQVYSSVACTDTDIAMVRLVACISDINTWMQTSRLWLKPAKTHVIWLGFGQLLRRVSICNVPVLSTQVKPVKSVHDLVVVIDSELSLSAYITALCRSGYYQLTHTQHLRRQKLFCCPRVGNALPSLLRRDMNYRHFKHALKRHI